MPDPTRPPRPAWEQATDAAWRREVGLFRAAYPRWTPPLAVHVGLPAGPRRTLEIPWPVPAEYDEGLRRDLAATLLAGWLDDLEVEGSGGVCEHMQRGCAWMSRPGAQDTHDQDHGWHAALSWAGGAHAVELTCFRVVTKAGWVDLRTGERRTWARLRL